MTVSWTPRGCRFYAGPPSRPSRARMPTFDGDEACIEPLSRASREIRNLAHPARERLGRSPGRRPDVRAPRVLAEGRRSPARRPTATTGGFVGAPNSRPASERWRSCRPRGDRDPRQDPGRDGRAGLYAISWVVCRYSWTRPGSSPLREDSTPNALAALPTLHGFQALGRDHYRRRAEPDFAIREMRGPRGWLLLAAGRRLRGEMASSTSGSLSRSARSEPATTLSPTTAKRQGQLEG